MGKLKGNTLPEVTVTNRLKSLDALRTLAIMLMLTYHTAYDLREYSGFPIDYHSPFWSSVGKTSALLFMILSGFSAGLSKNPSRRGLQVFTWGMVITLATYIFMPKTYVRFGILHFLGIGMLLSPYLLRLKPLVLLLIGVVIGITGHWAAAADVPHAWFLPLGLTYRGFSSIDYYPLFPYLSATIIGILIYKYYQHKYGQHSAQTYKQHSMPTYRSSLDSENAALAIPKRWARLIENLSKHSLAIYLVHQPLLVGSLLLLKPFLGGPNNMLTIPYIFMEFKTALYVFASTWVILVLSMAFYLGYKLLHHAPEAELPNQTYPELADIPTEPPQGDGTGSI